MDGRGVHTLSLSVSEVWAASLPSRSASRAESSELPPATPASELWGRDTDTPSRSFTATSSSRLDPLVVIL